MTTPAYLISIILATLYGTVFHLYKGGDASRILLYVVSSWMGFIIGHNVSQIVGASIYSIGPLNAGMASLGSGLALVLAHWLANHNRAD
jgi:hypothetical protein